MDRMGPKSTPQAALRTAARAWSKDAQRPIIGLSTPRQMPDDSWRLSAPCNKCSSCASGAGLVYQFTGSWAGEHDSVYSLRIECAGQCVGEAKIARAPKKHQEDTITVMERQRILAEAEELKAQQRPATTTSVSMRLKGLSIPAARVRSVLKNMKKHWGGATKNFAQSARTFRSFVEGFDKSTLRFDFLEMEPSIRWVVTVQPLLSALVSLKPEFLYVTSDATHNLELMGYRYGLVCAWNGLLHFCFFASSPQQTYF